MGGFNGKLCAQWVCSMGKYFGCCWGYYLCAQQGIIGGLNGVVLCAQWKGILDAPWLINGVLNGEL